MNLKKVLSLSLGLVVLATVAVLTGTGTVGASPHLNSLITSPPPPSVPVSVVNTPLAVTGTVTANIGTPTVNANINGTPTVNVASLPPVSATPYQLFDYRRQPRDKSRTGANCRQGPLSAVSVTYCYWWHDA